MKTILITGGTGLIGRYLIKSLSKDSNTIYVLTRSESRFENNVNFINWDPDSQRLDLSNIPAVDHILMQEHLLTDLDGQILIKEKFLKAD